MNAEQKHELMFIIAKYLKTVFPDVADVFIQRCEEKNLFPSPVFSSNATFDELQSLFLPGVPDDQLVRILSHAHDKSKFSSLLAVTTNINTPVNRCEILTHKIGNPFPELYKFSAQNRVIGHTNKIYCLAVDATSQVLITGSDDNRIKVWKIPELVLMKSFCVNTDSITDLAVHPSNLYFGASSHDTTISLFSFRDLSFVKQIKMNDMVHNLKFSPSGEFFGAACQEGSVPIFIFNDAIAHPDEIIKPIKVVFSPYKKPVAWLSFSPSGEFFVFSADQDVIVVSSISENCSIQLKGHTNLPDYVFFSKITCKRILSLSQHERGIRLWESKNGAWDESFFLPAVRKSKIWRCVFNSDESRIIGVSSSAINVWDIFSKQQLFSLTHHDYTDHSTIVIAHPFNPRIIFVSTSKGKTSLWDIFSGELICGLMSQEGAEINEAVWSPDGQFIFTSDSEGGITIYLASTNSSLARVTDAVPYTEMFFLPEVNQNEVNPSDDNIIGDHLGRALFPQPQRYFLKDLRLDVKQNSFSKSDTKYDDQSESEILDTMKTLAAIETDKENNTNGNSYHNASGDAPIFLDGQENIDSDSGSTSDRRNSRRRRGRSNTSQNSRTRTLVRERTSYSENYEYELEDSSSTEELTSAGSLSSDDQSENIFPSSQESITSTQLPDWAFFSQRKSYVYIPQIGENIVYFKEGHEEWYKTMKFKKYQPPYMVDKNMGNVSFAHISNIQFFTQYLLLSLQFSDFEAKVAYPVPESPPFIVSESRYFQSLQIVSKLKPKDIVQAFFEGDDGTTKPFDCIIKSIKKGYRNNPYGCISAVFDDDKSLATINPWEIVFNVTENDYGQKMKQLMDSLCPVIAEEMQKKNNKMLVNLRRPDYQSILKTRGILPLDLSLISDRLINYWYTNVISLKHDVELLKINAVALNINDHQAAELVTKKLLSIIDKNASGLKISNEDEK